MIWWSSLPVPDRASERRSPSLLPRLERIARRASGPCERADRLDDLNDVCDAIRATGRQAYSTELDLPGLDSIDAMVNEVTESAGRIDVLVNNAGINVPNDAFDVTEEEWDAVQGVNLKGLFFTSQRVGRQMRRQKRGRIINIASQNGVVGYYKRAAYCSSKGGVVNLTRVLALEWAPFGINVNAVGPIFTLTPLTQSTFDDPDLRKDIESRIPVGRVGQPEDVTGAVVFLASPAANMITGHTLLVDGGWTAM